MQEGEQDPPVDEPVDEPVAPEDPNGGACYLKAWARGIGKAIHACREGEEQSGLLCYPKCNPGYYGVGPVCWQDCPQSFRDDGAFCYKPSSYGRGVGYALWNEDKCNRENNNLGCEKWGLIWYPKCKANFHNVACCVCSPDCPEGMTDIGISCAKKSYGRGIGKPLTCSTHEQMSALLCYPQCPSDVPNSIGPICWGNCPEGYNQCGALCMKDKECTSQIKSYFSSMFDVIKAFASEQYTEGIINSAVFATEFMYSICK